MRPTAEDRPASTPALQSRKKTDGQPPAMHVHAAPRVMDDGSDMDMSATASQVRNPPAVTHARRQAQAIALNKSTASRRTSHRVVPDDEGEENEEDITDQEDENEDDIYGGVDSAASNALENEVGELSHWPVFQIVYVSRCSEFLLLGGSF